MAASRIVLSLIATAAMAMFFQNCSQVDFANPDSAPSLSKLDSSSTDDVDGVVGDDYVPDPDEPMIEEQEEFISSTCDGMKTMPTPGTLTDQSYQQVRGQLSVSNAHNLSLNDIRGVIKVGYAEHLSSQNTRGFSAGYYKQVVNLLDHRGALCATFSSHMTNLQNVRGLAVLRGAGREVSSIDQILDYRGKLKIYGAHIKSIQNTRGTLRIVDSDVDEIEDHSGSIFIENGQLKSFKNVRGVVFVNGVRVN